MKRRLRYVLLWLLLGVLAFPAQAAVVFLKDGSQVRGTIVSATAQDVQLHTENGTLRIAADKILRIDYAETGAVTPPSPEVQKQASPEPFSRQTAEPVEDLKQVFSFDLGFASPVSRLDPASSGGNSARNGGMGLRLGFEYLYQFSPRVGAGLDFHYFHRSATDDFGLIPSGYSNISGNTIMPLAVVKVSLTDRGRSRPYFLAGLGGNYTSTIVDSQPLEGFAWDDTGTWETRRLVDDSKWGWASRAALGIDFYQMDPGLVSLELGWMGIHNSRYKGTLAGQDLGLDSVTGALNGLSLSVRWGWRF